MTPALDHELEEYHRLATIAFQQNNNPTISELWVFWQDNAITLPEWSKSAMEVGLIMTSSACVERIFSLYDNMFTDHQERALEDRREASVMLRFNDTQRRLHPI